MNLYIKSKSMRYLNVDNNIINGRHYISSSNLNSMKSKFHDHWNYPTGGFKMIRS